MYRLHRCEHVLKTSSQHTIYIAISHHHTPYCFSLLILYRLTVVADTFKDLQKLDRWHLPLHITPLSLHCQMHPLTHTFPLSPNPSLPFSIVNSSNTYVKWKISKRLPNKIASNSWVAIPEPSLKKKNSVKMVSENTNRLPSESLRWQSYWSSWQLLLELHPLGEVLGVVLGVVSMTLLLLRLFHHLLHHRPQRFNFNWTLGPWISRRLVHRVNRFWRGRYNGRRSWSWCIYIPLPMAHEGT